MKYLKDYKEGDMIQETFLCKDKKVLQAKTGKTYHSLTLQDKTKAVDAKIWDPGSMGIEEYENGDYVYIVGEMTVYNSAQQIKITRLRKIDKSTVNVADYMPSTKGDIDQMWDELTAIKDSVQNMALKKLLDHFFTNNEMITAFKMHSAAKKMHHAFVGGLLEHTLAVAKVCSLLADLYPALNRDLLITGGILHDIGKIREIAPFPENDYTDSGQLLGHIVIGVEMIHDAVKDIPEFTDTLEYELSHMILSHHGEYEYGSPKKPAMIEALALNIADNADAKLQMFMEILDNGKKGEVWQGYSKPFDSYIRTTEV